MKQTDLEKKIRAYALKNALTHNGKAMQGSVISGLFAEGLKKQDIGKHAKQVSKIVSEINRLSIENQQKEFESLKKLVSEREIREGLPELPDVPKSGVVMRSAPSASGALHVLHAINASLSYDFVKKYGGKMIVRIEDTNPENIDPLAYKLITSDAKWLFNGEAEIYIQSDRMNLYYEYAEKLIKKDAAYVCTCSSEKFKYYVLEMKNCPCRNNTKKKNFHGTAFLEDIILKIWNYPQLNLEKE